MGRTKELVRLEDVIRIIEQYIPAVPEENQERAFLVSDIICDIENLPPIIIKEEIK